MDETIAQMHISSENFDYSQLNPSLSNGREHPPKGSVPTNTALAHLYHANENTLLGPQMPGIWSHEYQMGFNAYQWAVSNQPRVHGPEETSIAMTNSPFSDHITLIELLVMESWSRLSSKTQPNVDL